MLKTHTRVNQKHKSHNRLQHIINNRNQENKISQVTSLTTFRYSLNKMLNQQDHTRNNSHDISDSRDNKQDQIDQNKLNPDPITAIKSNSSTSQQHTPIQNRSNQVHQNIPGHKNQ